MPWKLLHILLVTLALAGYAAWLRTERTQTPVPLDVATATTIPLIRAAEAHELWKRDSTLFVDVRPAAEYANGHISGAILLPEEEFEERFPTLKARLEWAQAIVVYCKSEDCGKSLWTDIRLRGAGLIQTRIYPAGWYDWKRHDLPVSAASP